jgi:probable HAF family extracellular repeat protein
MFCYIFPTSLEQTRCEARWFFGDKHRARLDLGELAMKLIVTLSSLLSLGAILFSGTTAHAELYTLTDLGTLGGTSSYAYGINDAGQVVGTAFMSGDKTSQAFLYSNGTMTALGALGGVNSTAYGINDAGQVVGTANLPGDANQQAFVYSNNAMTDLGTLGGKNSIALGINDSGQIVGTADDTTSGKQAFLYSNGTMTSLGTLGGNFNGANAINNAGQIVGSSEFVGNAAYQAFVYSNGKMTALGTLGGTNSIAKGINSAGQIVGTAEDGTNAFQAFVYSNGTMTGLGLGSATGINRAGQVVGYINTTFGGVAPAGAFLFSNGTLFNLKTLLDSSGKGWSLVSAQGINDNGQIVGYGWDPQFQEHAFLLTPVPLPGAALLFGSGLFTLLRWRLRTAQRDA